MCIRDSSRHSPSSRKLGNIAKYLQDKTSNTCFQVNPDIVGGLVVEVGDRTIDLSVSSRIAKMNKLLTDTL